MDRASEGSLPGADEARIARGIDARRPSGDEVVALMRTLAARLELSRQSGSVSALMEFVYSNLTSGAAHLSEVRVACGAGCSHCCHTPWIDASPAEVLFAVKSLGAEQRQRVALAVDSICERRAGKSFEESCAIIAPCPLLEDHRCGIYGERPIVCRSLVSADAMACRRVYLERSGESFPAPKVWRTLGAAYAVALEGAVLHAGLVATARGWAESLRCALGDPAAEARWLAGEDVFKDAPRTIARSNFEAPSWAYLYQQAFGERPPTGR